MHPKFFGPDDFGEYELSDKLIPFEHFAAKTANDKLEMALGAEVFQVQKGNIGNEWVEYNPMTATFSARLFNIKEVVYECINHIPTLTGRNVMGSGIFAVDYIQGCGIKCKNCGKALKAEWKEA